MPYTIDDLIKRYPALEVCRKSIEDAYKILEDCYSSGHKLLVAGNGGSACDAEHIVGELMKGFKNERHLDEKLKKALKKADPMRGRELSEKLQGTLPAIALDGHPALNTAFCNDVADGGLYLYAQEVMGYGNKDDVFLAISTSGNSQNILYACVAAKAKGLKVIGLTGKDGGELSRLANVSIIVPSEETFMIQEYHLPIYHLLCLMLEEKFFG